MKKLILLFLALGLTFNCYAQEQISQFDDNGLVILNDELRKLLSDIYNLQNNADTKMDNPASPEQGDILYYNGTDWVILHHGTSGQYLITQGHAANPTWLTVSLDNISNKQLFIADGNFTAPAGITTVYITMVGGGGGGGGSSSVGAGGGGGGEAIIKYPYTVVPTSVYIVDVGAKGLGGAGSGDNPGTAGASSAFDTGGGNLTVSGGMGGLSSGQTGGAGGSANSMNGSGSTAGSFYSIGGGTGSDGLTTNYGGGGGGSVFGIGGAGGVDAVGVNATGFGAGGGGADESNHAGGNGTQGFVLIEY